ncbi:alpha/beta hydrolase-fold protein [candidate division KSB1 bacterium]
MLPTTTNAQDAKVKFEITVPKSVKSEPVTGRMFIIITKNADHREPRLQTGRTGTPFFGVDVEQLEPGKPAVIDGTTLGSPLESLAELPPGEYFIQGFFCVYTKFERSDGHVVWMHNDQWEGQSWERSPGNIYSDVQKVTIDPMKKETFKLEVTNVIPPVEIPPDTKYVKRIKIQSKVLSEFWGQPIYIGATVLLPWGYDTHPNVYYPTVHYHGHFSLRAPLGFREGGSGISETWTGINFPRFIAITFQHPCPYFDDSYAVNSPSCGPYGDAIHDELIPEIEKQFRCIPESYARVLTGGSTGGWISFALQVLYPDVYGGTWSFAPDPLHFNNVEGINIYEDTNAYYDIHEWRKVPKPNTINPSTGLTVLTSKQRNYYELTCGTKGRSGEQIDIWSAVFGPVGEDGYFKPLFDKRTGDIDPEVVKYWAENYDMRNYLERNWPEIGPKLVGKLHVFCGDRDNYQLNFGVYETDRFLESTRDPYYAGSFSYGARGSHGWRPMSSEQMLLMMAQHILKNTPPGASKAWMY